MLIGCGFEEEDAKTYLTLARMGLSRVSDLARVLKMSRMNAYRKLKKLQDEGLVAAALGKPIRFQVVSIEDVLDRIDKDLKDRVLKVESNRSVLIQALKTLTPVEPTVPKFQIHQGRSKVYDQIIKMCKSAKEEIRIIATGKEIARLALIGLDDVLKEVSEGVNVRILTEVDESNIHSLEEAMEYAQLGHYPKLPHQRLVIVDRGSVLSSMMLTDSMSIHTADDIALCTDAQDYIGAMISFFDQTWENSVDCEAAIQAFRSSTPLQQIKVVGGLEAYTELATKMITQAKSLITATYGSLNPQLLYRQLLQETAKRGVQVRVLMSINQGTLQDAMEMLRFAKVKHLGTPIGFDVLLTDGLEILQRFPVVLQTGDSSFPQAVWSNIPRYVHNSAEIVEQAWEKADEAASIMSKLEAEKMLQDSLQEVRQLLERKGFVVEMPATVKGDSGVLHRFDLISKSPKDQEILLVADLKNPGLPMLNKIVDLYVKSKDVHQEAFLFTAVDPDENQLHLAEIYGIRIIAGTDKVQLISKYQASIQEIIKKRP